MQSSRLLPRAAFTVLAAGGGTYAYYRYSKRNDGHLKEGTFSITISQRNVEGKVVKAVMDLPYLPDATLEKRVKLFSRTLYSDASPYHERGGSLIKFHAAQLNSNDPVEDMEPEATTYLYEGSSRRPIIVAAVADGHSGPFTSAWLKGRLSNLTMLSLLNSGGFGVKDPLKEVETSPITLPPKFKLDSNRMSTLIKTAWEVVDDIITWRIPRELNGQDIRNEKVLETLGARFGDQILPAYSGACALAAIVDTEEQEMWVACTGDCRAVAGFWDEKPDGSGVWRVDVLSEDQTAESPKEVARLIKEHPKDDSADVVKVGRVLGNLQPSRAFGDLRYKWGADLQNFLLPKLLPPNMRPRPPPAKLLTPPYVTASPEVQHRKFTLPSSATSDGTRSTLRFLILATDGLWDELTSTNAVALVGGHLQGQRNSIANQNLTKSIPTIEENMTKTSAPLPHAAKRVRHSDWSFKEESLGMHLIRNALGGIDNTLIQQHLSIPAPYSRRYRDDISVLVLTFEGDEGLEQPKTRAKL
ncbi:hypothetical protein FS842_006581 [Serendipita sp. 407]|nr:hypothetical protein FRC16_006088 [Serendipita sp. 398]KAG9053972.1 hypothetical protein FS842_006581 [Serendipita sp. 407]